MKTGEDDGNSEREYAQYAIESDGRDDSSKNGEHFLNSSCGNGESGARGGDDIEDVSGGHGETFVDDAILSRPGAYAISGPITTDAESVSGESHTRGNEADRGDGVFEAEVEPVLEGFVPRSRRPRTSIQEQLNHLETFVGDAILSRPGAHAINGPNFDLPVEADRGDGVFEAEVEPVLEGFVPGSRRPSTSIQEQLNHLRRTAITLDDAAVQPVHDDSKNGARHDENEAEGSNDSSFLCTSSKNRALSIVLILALLSMVVVLAVVSGSARSGNSSSSSIDDNDSAPFYYSCDEIELFTNDETTNNRYDIARQIISRITPVETLDDLDSPQGKALRWIVCEDTISLKLLDQRDHSTGQLPKQAHGSLYGGNSGESQVIRRYALATFFFSTSEDGPWDDSWNFLTPNIHECGWHKNYTRENWPYGDFDPAGFLCSIPTPTSSLIVLDDKLMEISHMHLNFRIPNNLTGTLPPEMGHLIDVKTIGFENQAGLRGSLPSSIGSMISLKSISILFAGSGFGGEIPASLFSLPNLEYVSFFFNEGIWQFSDAPESDDIIAPITSLIVRSCGLTGTLPDYISKLQRLKELGLDKNSLQGSIPEAYGNLASLEYLNMYDNQLTGTLPEALGNLTNATAIVLGRNKFHGGPPSITLGKLENLRLLDLSYNELEGSIPTSFSRLVGLEHISLQHNKLSGSIAVFAHLEHLSSLIVSSNQFSGSIPMGLFSNSTVDIFADFSRNGFVGELPQDFAQIATNITYLSIANNNITDDTVDDVMCEEVSSLLADCSSCPCCKSCCGVGDKGSVHCNLNLDFHVMVGLDCGAWWVGCIHANPSYEVLPTDSEN